MKKLFFVLLLFGAMLMFGCTTPGPGTPGSNGSVLTGTNATGKFVLFSDPRDNSSDMLISRVEKITQSKIEIRCIDFYKVYYNQSSDAESVCRAKNTAYDQDVAMLRANLEAGTGSFFYYYTNNAYSPVELSVNPAVTANNMCDKTGCVKTEVKNVTAKVYIAADNDKNALGLFNSLSNYGVKLNYEYYTSFADLKQYSVSQVPVVAVDTSNLDEDNKIAVDLLFSQLVNPQVYSQTGWKVVKSGNVYVAEYMQVIDNSHYIGDKLTVTGTAFVKAESDMNYFSSLESQGIFVNATIGNGTAPAEYLPVLVLDKNSDITAIKNKLPSSYKLQSKNGTNYIELASPSLTNYAGTGYDNVTLDIFIMSECPYGLQMQKAVLPVAKLFQNVSSVHINNKFVYYTMHGAEETEYNLVQYCVNKEYPAKFWDYLELFVKDKNAYNSMAGLGINRSVIDACVANTKAQYEVSGTKFSIYQNENTLYGVSGSPTVVFNGNKVNMNRNAEYIKTVICSHLKDKPKECSTDLSSYGSAAPSFGPLTGTASSGTPTASCG